MRKERVELEKEILLKRVRQLIEAGAPLSRVAKETKTSYAHIVRLAAQVSSEREPQQ